MDKKLDLKHMAENARQAESFLKMFANQNRLLILCALVEKERSVSELNETIPLSQSALSQHLASLRTADLVTTRKVAQTVYYSVADDRVRQILEKLYVFFCQPK